jgi:RimJ/RimL family protein N-acetyltransferase
MLERMPALLTERLELVPVTLELVEAVLRNERGRAERLVGARLPDRWPGEQLIARAFTPSLEATRADPERRLWGDSILITRDDDRRVVGSVIFHGRPDGDGIAEVGYGVEESSQGRGYATEGTRACIEWALGQSGVVAVRAVTFPWHVASLRVIQKCGMAQVDTREHAMLGEMLVFERARPPRLECRAQRPHGPRPQPFSAVVKGLCSALLAAQCSPSGGAGARPRGGAAGGPRAAQPFGRTVTPSARGSRSATSSSP